VANDFKEGKITLPVIEALRRCSNEERGEISRAAKKKDPDPEDIQMVFDLVERYGGLEYTRLQAIYHKNRAQEVLHIFPPGEDRQVLTELADFVVERRK